MGLFGPGKGGSDKKTPEAPSVPSSSAYVPIKLRIIRDKSQGPVIPLKRTESEVPAFMAIQKPTKPNVVLPPMQPVATRVADAIQPPLVTGDDLEKLQLGDILVYGSGTLREVIEIQPGGAIRVVTTKRWQADELDGQFVSERGENGLVLSLKDYAELKKDHVIYPNFEVVEGNGDAFKIVEIQKSGETVTGVVLSFSQTFPQGFKADLPNIAWIDKPK